jgi:hypothetical protein
MKLSNITIDLKIRNQEKLQDLIEQYQKALKTLKDVSWDLAQFQLELEVGSGAEPQE